MKRALHTGIKISRDAFSKIAIPTSEGYELINHFEIIRCEADVNYTRFVLYNSRIIISSKPLKRFAVELKSHHFQRVHKSHLVNLLHAVKYIKGRGGRIALSDKSVVPVSFRHKRQLLDEIKKMK